MQSPILLKTPWAQSVAEVENALMVIPTTGLTANEAHKRMIQFGENSLQEVPPKSVWAILFDHLKSLIVWLLVAGSVLSCVFGQYIESIAIFIVIVINTAIGFVTEWRALRSMEGLRKLSKVFANVRRDGKRLRVPARELGLAISSF